MLIEFNLMTQWVKAEPAARTADVLRGPCAAEAVARLREGFRVPSPDLLIVAAERFRDAATFPIHDARGFSPRLLLEAWRAFDIHWRGLADAADLAWSSHWSLHQTRIARELEAAAEITRILGRPELLPGWLARAQADYTQHQGLYR